MIADPGGLGRRTIQRHFWLVQKKTKMGHSAKSGKGSSFGPEPEEYNKMGSRGSKPLAHNGYRHHSRLSLTTLKWHSKLFRTRESCQSEPSSVRWRKCQGQGLQHNSASVRDGPRECSFVENLHRTQTPLPVRKRALDLPTQFTGQRNCGASVCAAAQQSASVGDPRAPGRSGAPEHTFEKRQAPKTSRPVDCSLDSARELLPNSMGHVAEDSYRSVHDVFFTTEVPQKEPTVNHKTSPKEGSPKLSGHEGPPTDEGVCGFKSKRTQRVLQDQIRNVVVNLEEVLRDLKEVHLEMKEVVQQIDRLTSGIDLGEEDSGGRRSPCDESVCTRRLETCRKDKKRGEGRLKAAPPAYLTALSSRNNPGRNFNPTVSETGPKSEAGAASRNRKPPPYPVNSRTWGANKGKTPPSAGRRRLLSTTV